MNTCVFGQRRLLCTLSFFIVSTLTGCSSFFLPRNLSRNAVYELAQSRYFAQHTMLDFDSDTFLCVATATPLYRKTGDAGCLAGVLGPGKSPVNVKQDGTGEIWSEWLGIACSQDTPFASRFALRPERTVYGAHLNAYINLEHTYEGLWANVATFAGIAEHDLHFEEFDLANEGCISRSRSLETLFANTEWDAGIIPSEPIRRSGLDDVFAKLGYSHFFGDENALAFYIVGNFPTAQERKVTRLFDPLLGSPFYYAGAGAHLDYGRWFGDTVYANIMIDGWFARGFEVTEHRLFDLAHRGAWSRYMQFIPNEPDPELLQGPNVLFTKAKIDPGNIAQLLCAFHIDVSGWNVECGYNYWYRSSETVKKILFGKDVGIAYLPGVAQGEAKTAHWSSISSAQLPELANKTFRFIDDRDLDVHSAIADQASSHTVYASVLYATFVDKAPVGVGIGGQYEHSDAHCVPSAWSIWGKLCLGF